MHYPEAYARFAQWLAQGLHGTMGYLENHAEIRQQPERLLPGARSAHVFALAYFKPELGPEPRVALYAHYADYHRVLRERLETLAERFWPREDFRAVVDSAPVLERALAAQTARGFIGKNTLYIHPEHGSFLLLGEVLVKEQAAWDVPPVIPLERKTREGGCGPCRLCKTACPTGALRVDYQIDAQRCLSYWTIEQRGTIPVEFWEGVGRYYFGCDLCQLACPYNKNGMRGNLEPREYPDLFTVATMDQVTYEKWFGGTPLTRAKRSGLRRNALIAMAVRGDSRLEEALALVADEDVLVSTREQIRDYKRD